MSKNRSRYLPAATVGGLALTCLLAALPLSAQTAMDGPGVTVDTGGAVMHRVSVTYPDAARRARVQGVVTVEATLDSSGNVVETRVMNGPNELRRAAQQSVLSWHFAMDTSLNTRQVKVTFELPPQAEAPATAIQGVPRKNAEGGTYINGTQSVTVFMPPSSEGKRVSKIYIGGLSEQGRNDLLSRLPVHEGDTLTADNLARLVATMRAFDEHLTFGTAANQSDEVSLTIQTPGAGGFSGTVNTVSPAPMPPPADGTKRITIGGNVQQAKLVSQPRPVYPPLAKQARIQGVVHLTAVIGKEGNVANLAVISGHPLLVPPALDAVRQWVYQKTLLNGDPVEVLTQIDVNFTLSGDAPPQQ